MSASFQVRQVSKKDRTASRWFHTYRLWRKLLSSQDGLPQCDRWISTEFAGNKAYGSRDRRWYGEVLFAAVRFGYLALYCEKFFQSLSSNLGNEGYTGEHFSSLSEKQLAEFTENFSKEYSSGDEVFQAWKQLDEKRFFTWVRIFHSSLSLLRPGSLLPFEEISCQGENEKELENIFSRFFSILLPFLQEEQLQGGALLARSLPLWHEEALKKRIQTSDWDKKTVAHFLDSQTRRPPLWLRLNASEYVDFVQEEFLSHNFLCQWQGKTSLAVAGSRGIYEFDSFKRGMYEIQDFASQEIGSYVEALPGQFVWDCCAGGGGKTQQIAAMLKNKGVVYASDIREYKLDEVKKRARKAGFFNVRCIPWQGEALPEFPREVVNRKGFDRVLVDAPCSSSGTWRRNPDVKYRMSSAATQSPVSLQLQLLSNAARAVRQGGCLVYSTCSWFCEENEEVVSAFLQQHPEFSLIKQSLVGCPDVDADTMFAAIMRRLPS